MRILFANENAGAIDLVMDPTNPRVLYASTWRVRRTPYSLESGGEGSALWKSTDGGDTWRNLSRNKGLPKGTLGIIGVSVSRSNPQNVYAIIAGAEYLGARGARFQIFPGSGLAKKPPVWVMAELEPGFEDYGTGYRGDGGRSRH